MRAERRGKVNGLNQICFSLTVWAVKEVSPRSQLESNRFVVAEIG